MAKRKTMKAINTIAYWLLTIGALTWGLNEIGWNPVEKILGWVHPSLPGMVYWLVGFAGIYAVYLLLTKQLK